MNLNLDSSLEEISYVQSKQLWILGKRLYQLNLILTQLLRIVIKKKGCEKENLSDEWDKLLDFDFELDDLPPLLNDEQCKFMCKMGKGKRNKQRVMENLMYFDGLGTSSYDGTPLTQEEAEKKELAQRIGARYELLEAKRSVFETMAYQDKYKKLNDEI